MKKNSIQLRNYHLKRGRNNDNTPVYPVTTVDNVKGLEDYVPGGTSEGVVVDPNYVHTDNNYTNADKAKLTGLDNRVGTLESSNFITAADIVTSNADIVIIETADRINIKFVSAESVVSTLDISTDSISISTDQGVAATDTFTIQGSNLINGVTLALTDANNVFSLSKDSLTKTEAEAGATITVTYSSDTVGTHSGSIAVNWDGVQYTISLNGVASEATTSDAEGKFTKLDANGNTLYLKRKIVDGQKTNEVEVHQSNYDTNWNGTLVYSYSGDVVIPATVVVDGVTCNITTIAGNAFRFDGKRTQLKSITLPEGLTTINGYFLYYAQSVTSVIIPSTVEKIGGGFCTEASNLETIDMRCQKNSNFQTTFGDSNNPCCRHCPKLESFVIPDKVTTLNFGSYQNFDGNTAMTEITLGTDMAAFRALFQAATSVTKIYCRGTSTIPKINLASNQINYIDSTVIQNAQVYVPTGYKQAYLAVDDGRPANGKVWNPFESYHPLIEYNID